MAWCTPPGTDLCHQVRVTLLKVSSVSPYAHPRRPSFKPHSQKTFSEDPKLQTLSFLCSLLFPFCDWIGDQLRFQSKGCQSCYIRRIPTFQWVCATKIYFFSCHRMCGYLPSCSYAFRNTWYVVTCGHPDCRRERWKQLSVSLAPNCLGPAGHVPCTSLASASHMAWANCRGGWEMRSLWIFAEH